MKISKYKSEIYKVINTLGGDEFFTNRRPNKKQLKILCDEEFCWDEENFNDHYGSNSLLIEKIVVYDLNPED